MPLGNIASLAGGLNISLHVPEVVYLELEARCLSKYDDVFRTAKSKTSELRSRLETLGGDPAQIAEVTDVRTEMRKRYLATVEDLKQTFLPSPTARLQIDDLLKKAVAHELAFEDGDKGFRDTVIFLSAIDEVKTSPKLITALFVSNDPVFSKKKDHLESWAKSVGASMVLCNTLEEIEYALTQRQAKSVRVRIEADHGALVAALDQHLSDVQSWLDQNVESWNWQIVPFKIYKAEVLRLLSATPQYSSNRPEGANVKLSFTVEATLLGSYVETAPTLLELTPPARRTSSRSTSATAAYGTSAYGTSSYGAGSAQRSYPQPTPLRRQMGRFPAVVEVDAEAILEGGSYSNFRFLAARTGL